MKTKLLLLLCLPIVVYSFLTQTQSGRQPYLRNAGSIASFIFLNRILIDLSECNFSQDGDITAEFNATDYRYDHIKNILKLSPGNTFRSGVIDLGITNQAVVISMSETSSTEKIKKSEIKESNIIEVALGRVDELTKVTSRPCIDLILAAPRPLRLERIIPVASCLGVRRIAIIGAAKVEKDYFGSQLIRRPDLMRHKLVEGLEQAEVDCHLPLVTVHKSFNQFIKYDMFCSGMLSKDVESSDEEQQFVVGSSNDTATATTSDIYPNPNTTLPNSSSNHCQQPQRQHCIKIITQPLYPTMVQRDPQTGAVIAQLPPSRRFSDVFRSEFITKRNKIKPSYSDSDSDSDSGSSDYGDNISKQKAKVNDAQRELEGDGHLPYQQQKQKQKQSRQSMQTQVVVAVGPEGGWTYEELDAFTQQGFRMVHMGDRILRTDIAVQTSLGIVHELLGFYTDKDHTD